MGRGRSGGGGGGRGGRSAGGGGASAEEAARQEAALKNRLADYARTLMPDMARKQDEYKASLAKRLARRGLNPNVVYEQGTGAAERLLKRG
jgi:hypothetical protein